MVMVNAAIQSGIEGSFCNPGLWPERLELSRQLEHPSARRAIRSTALLLQTRTCGLSNSRK